jgi:lipopolysaccharide export LptBFGC system permease protein LptF
MTENSNRKAVQNSSNSNSMTNLIIKEVENSNASSHARITNLAAKNERTESLDAGWKSQKESQEYRSNPEEKKIQERQERRYDNIMENEEMGFKKNKVVKPREEVKESREPPR